MQVLTPGEMGLPRDARFVQPLDDDDQEASLNQRRQESPCLGPSFADSSPAFIGGNLRHRWLRLASVAMKTWTLALKQRAAVRIDG